ncbi:MAG: hypothetical protein NUV82_01810 [Candidatus Komeilibacteria bacterium]|nr:hypothetical protein [Candidatus Komeilibacteria bacterium]
MNDKTHWYAEPLDPRSNKIIGEFIVGDDILLESFSKKDTQGMEHNVFELKDYSVAKKILDAVQSLELKVEIFCAETGSKLRQPPFVKQKRINKYEFFREHTDRS